MNKIAQFVRESRKAAGLTQEEFAVRSGLGLRFVRELEQGKPTVRMDKVNIALAMFGMEAVPGNRLMDAFRAGFVYVEDCYAGTLSETEDGYRFAYDADYLSSENPRAVSLTLPLRDEPYDSSTLFSFFDGLIPEGWLLNVVTRNWKLNRKDRFGLLLVACRDTIGNVTIQEVRK